MRKVIYSMGVSLDGFIAGPDGEIDWSEPDEELHRFHNEQAREMGAHLYGRRLYKVMRYWETAEDNPSAPEHELEFARIWKAMPKVVFSRTLETVEGNARLVKNNIAEEIARLKEQPGMDPGCRRRRPGLLVHEAGSDRRIQALRPSGRPGRRHALLSAAGREDQPQARRDADVWL
jgi:dihydrofolate reductase